MLLEIGSKHSVLPRICDVLAVGIGAKSSEFRNPCFMMRSFREIQSYRPASGSTPHMSYCRMPCDAGDPAKVLYGPSFSAKSHDAVSAA